MFASQCIGFDIGIVQVCFYFYRGPARFAKSLKPFPCWPPGEAFHHRRTGAGTGSRETSAVVAHQLPQTSTTTYRIILIITIRRPHRGNQAVEGKVFSFHLPSSLSLSSYPFLLFLSSYHVISYLLIFLSCRKPASHHAYQLGRGPAAEAKPLNLSLIHI